ncbi:putative bifunctional diguanylate cyclase/phosphodiesterase [Pannonibacter tanglangensis]|uniref:putative bifunctional diguanylate cyclase/phosphodiesterase n=1 Tax=Pannonibacter tanglangensis TaxID=2750084 RepID=UPI001AD8E7F8|nr:EAL domain-containing protein [Pannonibacter sp. XCT-53]
MRSWFASLNSWARVRASALRTRFTLFVVSLCAAMIMVMVGVASYLDYRDEEAKALANIRAVANTVSRLAIPQLTNHHYLIMAQELESIAASGMVQTAKVYDPKRSILIDSDPATSLFDRSPVAPLLTEAVTAAQPIERIDSAGVHVALPVWSRDGRIVIGAVLVSARHPDLAAIVAPIWERNAIVAALLLALAVPLVLKFGSSFLEPIQELTRIAHQISGGDMDVRFPTERVDEIGVLARAYGGMMQQIRSSMEQINKLAFLDGVTGLPNREFFRQHFARWQKHADGSPRRMAVMFIDLDRFKRVNDSYGHDCGDLLLGQIARRFETILLGDRAGESPGAMVHGPLRRMARFGGDEFALLMPLPDSGLEPAVSLAERLLAAVEEPCLVNGQELTVGASIGLAVYPDDGTDVSAILKHADIAMYAAKAAGGNTLRVYSHSDGEVPARERLRLETDLRVALASDQITVFFQPKVDVDTGHVTGAEALARWNHPRRGLLTPGAFIEIAEETGLILRLGDRVLELACRQGRAWIDAGQPLPLAVNVSMRQLEWAGYTDRVLEILEATGFPPSMLELELTETVAMANSEQVRLVTERLRRAGIRFAIDDFGTGYSSLGHLQHLPFDTFKIDRSFISGLEVEGSNRLIVETILSMARSLNYEVVAEGVETLEQLEVLRATGCKTAQGYLFGMPMAATMFASWRRAFQPAVPPSALPSLAAARPGSGQERPAVA